MAGIYTNIVINDLKERAKGRLSYGTYTKKLCKKESKIHLAIQDSLRNPTVRELKKSMIGREVPRCTCHSDVVKNGGWVFTSIWGGDKMVCRHCGKQYFRKEFAALPKKKLEPAEFYDYDLFAMLLAGGDLREDKEKNVLILKDANGIPGGELPMGMAQHLAAVFKDANIITAVRNDTVKAHAMSLHLAPAGV